MTQQRTIAYQLVAAMVLFVTSCKKETGQQVPPPPVKNYQVVTTGSVYNKASAAYEGSYWINNKKFPLEMGGSQQVFPYGLEKAGNDFYFAGGYEGNHGGAQILLPCYWKNSTKVNLPVDQLEFYERCGSRDIRWFNGAWYVLGDADLQPVIWKIKGSQVTVIRPRGVAATSLGIMPGASLEVFNNTLYFAGTEKATANDGRTIFSAGYWTIDNQDDVTFHVVEDNLAYALCFGMAVSSKGLYIVGEYHATDPNDAKPVIWTPGGHLNVINQMNASKQRLNEVIVDNEGFLYVNVLDLQRRVPTVWKLTSADTYESFTSEIPAGAVGMCNNLATVDNKLAYAFTHQKGETYFAGYVFDGKTVPLEMDTSMFITISRTRVFAL
jgi:hypothetical protein